MSELETAANYVAVEDMWTDMPEAKPRQRVRSNSGRVSVIVTKDGKVHADGDVELDDYSAPKYADIRKEGRDGNRN